MKVIQRGRIFVESQKIQDSIKYRYSKYVIKSVKNNYAILYNVLNDFCVIINTSKKTSQIKSFLVKYWFLVPEDFNEFEFAQQIKNSKILHRRDVELKTISTYTILPTTDCNANCSYCFEFGARKLNMTKKTADDVINYIVNNSPESKKIKIRWFGGEPLYNSEIIDYITDKLVELGFDFKASIITNGYLANEEIANKFVNSWKIKSCQITLDGVDDVYNSVKNYIYDDDNCFMTVINNIKTLLSKSIKLSIRLNVTENNAQELIDLVEYLYNEFGRNKLLNIYCMPVYELFKDKPEIAFNNFERVMNCIITKYGYTRNLRRMVTNGAKCMANNSTSVVINPLGKISLCEHDVDYNDIGDIINGIDQSNPLIKEFREYLFLPEKCPTCNLYPACMKSKRCEGDGFCNDPKIKFELLKITRPMNAILNRYIKEKEREA